MNGFKLSAEKNRKPYKRKKKVTAETKFLVTYKRVQLKIKFGAKCGGPHL